MQTSDRLPVALLLLRLSVFTVMLVWTLDKFINPGHAAAVYENFYLLAGFGKEVMVTVGALELALLIAFVLGIGVLSLGLCLFQRGPSPVQPPEPIARALHFIGWHTLEIYVIQLAGSELIIRFVPSLAA